MFYILSLITYKVFLNDPPVIFLYKKDATFSGSILEAVESNGKTATLVRPSSSNLSVRISNIAQIQTACSISLSDIYVYPNSTDLETICNTPGYQITQINISSYEDACDFLKQNILVIATDHYPEFKKVGYSNPFTPGVWNCFFFIIFCLSFIIWSMIHYANIDVQTRFAKKLY
ncbi:hypothetical protein M9Y10_023508 [Tritrichomonas musculus]|uniref:Uncharacterized protein n=1 Tax=Tritrichomonas musculus TaxID=1915356 RepID=A0ABR2KWD3_9EUKA